MMARPSDLIAHYSSNAFYTRTYALTFSGAFLGAVLTWDRAAAESNLIGFVLIVVVGSLSAMNWRYVHSYVAACRASSFQLDTPEDELRKRWAYFSRISEYPWSVVRGNLYHTILQKRVPQQSWPTYLSESASAIGVVLKRFFLNWLTYVPGLAVGVLIIVRGNISKLGMIGLILAALEFLWWIFLSSRKINPEALKELQKDL